MNIEIIAIGDEVLLGFTPNTNAQFLANKLLDCGYTILRHEVVGDDADSILSSLQQALHQQSIVIVTGGLGPTLDDITREAVAKLFSRKLITYSNGLRNETTAPEGSYIFENYLGTALGFALEDETRFPGATLICLPGVPMEMHKMCIDSCIPYLQKRQQAAAQTKNQLFVYPIHLAMVPENAVDPILRTLEKEGFHCGIYPSHGTLTIHIQRKAADWNTFLRDIAPAKELLFTHFSQHIYESKSGKIEEPIHQFFIDHRLTLSCAESCTAGALSARFVAMPDASKYFMGSVVAYSNEVKKSLLQVPDTLLSTYGAVSEEVVAVMAQSVLDLMHTDIAIATSGIFGPGGGSQKKPVGHVCAAIISKTGKRTIWTMQLTSQREVNCDLCIANVMSHLLLFIKNHFDDTT